MTSRFARQLLEPIGDHPELAADAPAPDVLAASHVLRQALSALPKRQREVDEARVLEALDGVLAVERDIKRLHITTLARIRNVLTPRQRTRLNEFR